MSESLWTCHTHECATAHILAWKCWSDYRVTVIHVNVSLYTSRWVMSSRPRCHMPQWVMSHTYMGYVVRMSRIFVYLSKITRTGPGGMQMLNHKNATVASSKKALATGARQVYTHAPHVHKYTHAHAHTNTLGSWSQNCCLSSTNSHYRNKQTLTRLIALLYHRNFTNSVM